MNRAFKRFLNLDLETGTWLLAGLAIAAAVIVGLFIG
jgi:hypothetical protein